MSMIEKSDVHKLLKDESIMDEIVKKVLDNPDKLKDLASALEISTKTETKAMKILEEAEKKGILFGKIPTGFAAVAIYLATIINKEKKTQREIALAAGIAEQTLRNRYQELLNKISLEEANKAF